MAVIIHIIASPMQEKKVSTHTKTLHEKTRLKNSADTLAYLFLSSRMASKFVSLIWSIFLPSSFSIR